MQLRQILGHTFVASVDKSRLDLDDSGRVLDVGTDSSYGRLKLIGDGVFWAESFSERRFTGRSLTQQ